MKRLAQLSVLLASILVAVSAQAADKKIERLFGSKCSACHGKDGKAQTEKGQKMKVRDMSSEAFQKETDEDMRKSITEGIKKERDGVKLEMDSFKDELKPEEVDALVKYVRAFKK